MDGKTHDIVIKYRKWYQFWKPSTIVMGCSCGFKTTDFKGMASHYRYVVRQESQE